MWARRVELDTCASTNDEALALARAGTVHGTVVTARTQTRGRGRAGRAWHSPPGTNVYLSLVLRPALPPAVVPAITLAAGVGVCDAVRAAGVARARLKWPNDVLAGDRKLAGILTEMTTRGDRVDAVVVGIGVDVDTPRAALPAELAAVATSVRDETGAAQDVAAFTELLLACLAPPLERFAEGGVAAIAADWEARADLTRLVRAGDHVGRPLGLAPDGSLRIDVGGREIRVTAGDVVET